MKKWPEDSVVHVFWVIRLPPGEHRGRRWLSLNQNEFPGIAQDWRDRSEFDTKERAYEILWRWRRHVRWCPSNWWGFLDVKKARVFKVTRRRTEKH